VNEHRFAGRAANLQSQSILTGRTTVLELDGELLKLYGSIDDVVIPAAAAHDLKAGG
jgi:hypothetical protein